MRYYWERPSPTALRGRRQMPHRVGFLPIALFISLCLYAAPTSAGPLANTLYLNEEITLLGVALCETHTQAIGAAKIAAWVGGSAGDAYLKDECGINLLARIIPLRVIAITDVKDAPGKKAKVIEVAHYLPGGGIVRRYVVVPFDVYYGRI